MCRSSTKQTHTPPKHTVRYVEAENSSSDKCTDEYAYMTSQGETVSVKVGNMPITMLIDPGSTCTDSPTYLMVDVDVDHQTGTVSVPVFPRGPTTGRTARSDHAVTLLG